MEFVTISHWDVQKPKDEMMDEAAQKFMPMILATGADVYMVRQAKPLYLWCHLMRNWEGRC